MQSHFTQRLRSLSFVPLMVCALQPAARATPIPAHHPQGTIHGFLELRSEDGHIVASGDITQVVHGDRITLETLFHFKDGSVDDEITVFSQRHTFQLISDRHVQKGPYFPHPVDALIEARSGQIIVRTTDKDGKQDVKTDHMNLPTDLANGLVPIAVEGLSSGAPNTTASMVVLTPKPRLVKLNIYKVGEDEVSVAGTGRKAIHYEIKIDLGGVIGVVAPLVGKAPPNIEIWTIGGQATTFAREIGPLYAEGPMMTIQLTSPVWPETTKPKH